MGWLSDILGHKMEWRPGTYFQLQLQVPMLSFFHCYQAIVTKLGVRLRQDSTLKRGEPLVLDGACWSAHHPNETIEDLWKSEHFGDLWVSLGCFQLELVSFASFPCTSLDFMLTLIIFDPPQAKKKCDTSSCNPSLFEIIAPSRRESSFFSSSTSGFVGSHRLQLRIYSFL